MSIDITHTTPADDGPLRVVNYGPFTDIQLAPGQYLTVRTPADCDRLAAAAAEAKRLTEGHAVAMRPDHAFVRPGQVAPDRPAPDQCMACGEPEAAHLAAAEASPANPYGTIPPSVEDTAGRYSGHLPQHTGGQDGCTYEDCGEDHGQPEAGDR